MTRRIAAIVAAGLLVVGVAWAATTEKWWDMIQNARGFPVYNLPDPHTAPVPATAPERLQDTCVGAGLLQCSGLNGTISVASGAGAIACGLLPTFIGDVTTPGGSCVTTLTNIPNDTPMAGDVLPTAIAAPGTPAAGKARVYVDSTSKNLAVKNDAGTVNHGVQTKTAIANQFLTAIADNGTVSAAQPAFSSLSGSATCAQLPALTGDVGTSAGSCSTTLNQIPDGTPALGDILFTAEAAPATPAAGTASVYVDSTSKAFAVKNDAGTVSHTVQTKAAVANQFLTAVADTGVVSAAQPTFSNLSGSATCAQLPALTGDITTPGGSCATTLANIPNDTPMAGDLLATAIAAPATPAAGKARPYVDSTSKAFAVKNDAGTVSHTVQTKTSTANQFLTAIADTGVVSAAQPAFSNLSGSVACSQLPALTGDITTSGGSCATSLGSFTNGSVMFWSGGLAQDNTNLSFDDTNNRLGIRTAAPTQALDVASGNVHVGSFASTGASLVYSTSAGVLGTLTSSNGRILIATGSSAVVPTQTTSAFTYDAGGTNLFTVNSLTVDSGGNLSGGSITSSALTSAGTRLVTSTSSGVLGIASAIGTNLIPIGNGTTFTTTSNFQYQTSTHNFFVNSGFEVDTNSNIITTGLLDLSTITSGSYAFEFGTGVQSTPSPCVAADAFVKVLVDGVGARWIYLYGNCP